MGKLKSRIIEIIKRQPSLDTQMTSLKLRQKYTEKFGITVGLYSYGCFDTVRFARHTTVGRYCCFAPSAAVYNRNHPMSYIGLTPYFYEPALELVTRDSVAFTKCSIGDDVWMGHNSVLLPGASSIGRGAVIGSGAIVTKDVPPYAIVVGNPGRIVGYRFDKATIAAIEKTEWWMRTPAELKTWIGEKHDLIYDPARYFHAATAHLPESIEHEKAS